MLFYDGAATGAGLVAAYNKSKTKSVIYESLIINNIEAKFYQKTY